jgi:hypothetical protein
VLDDILASPKKEGLARKAFTAESREIRADDDSYTADYQVGNSVLHEAYGTSIGGMDNTLTEKVYKPLGFVPYDDRFGEHEAGIQAGEPQMIRLLGRIARQHLDPQYKPKPLEGQKQGREPASSSQEMPLTGESPVQDIGSSETKVLSATPEMRRMTPRQGAQ